MNSTYSIPIRSAKKGESSIFRNPQAEKSLQNGPDSLSSLKDLILYAKTRFSYHPFIGTKQINNEYTFKTYGEIIDEAQAFGSSVFSKNLISSIKEFRNLDLRFLGIYSKNREEYLTVDISAMLYGITTVPIYDTLGPDALDYIMDQTKLNVMVITKENLSKMITHGNFGYIRTFITLDEISDEKIIKELSTRKITLLSFRDLVRYGRDLKVDFAKTSRDSIYVVSYTSGTTGAPKGAMMTNENFLSVVSVGMAGLDFRSDDVYLSYLPMAHVFERLMVVGMIYAGCSIGYFNGDPLKLKEDFTALRPTIIATVPRVLNRFYDAFKANIAGLTGCKKWLVNHAISVKLQNLKESKRVTHCCYDRIVFKKMREALGGRLRWIVIGSAPTITEVLDFMKIALCIPIQEGYGQTESTGASFLMNSTDHSSGTVGGPTVNTEFKIEDIPEMNYSSKDVDENNNPAPRGEMCIRGPGVFPGYYKDVEKTREALDEEGWLHTGDVVVLTTNGSIKIIDRKKNIFKLAQGEYVAPEKLESVYKNTPIVSEIFVWGDSYQNFLVAIVVPKLDELKKWAADNGIFTGSDEELLKRKETRVKVLEELRKDGKIKKFASFEIVKNVFLEKNTFMSKDLLTTTFKMKRNEAKKAYDGIINDLYKEGCLI